MNKQASPGYAPPAATVTALPQQPKDRPVLAVVLGLIAYYGTSLLIGAAIGVVFVVGMAASGQTLTSDAQFQQAFKNWLALPGPFVLLLSIGAVLAVVGGCLCARLAGRKVIVAAGIYSLVVLVIEVLTPQPDDLIRLLVSEAALVIATLAGMMLGHFLWRRRMRLYQQAQASA